MRLRLILTMETSMKYIILILALFANGAIADDVVAFGSNANNNAKGLQIGGGDPAYGTNGTLLNADGNASWMRIQPSQNESNVELLLYSSSAQGKALSLLGTSTITRTSGSPFKYSWIGRKFYFGDDVYIVAYVANENSLDVISLSGGAVSFSGNESETYHVSYTYGDGLCTVVNGVVTRTSGDPFIAFIAAPYKFTLNGAAYTVTSFTDVSRQTIAFPPADGTYAYHFETDINDQLATFRIQKMRGTDEENLSLYARYDGYHIKSLFSGSGKLRPIFMGSSSYTNLALYPDGMTSLGGDIGYEALRILPLAGTPFNRIEVQAGASGFTPTFRARGYNTTVGLGFDTQNAGNTRFTSHNFGKIEFEIFGVGGTSWLAVQSDNYGAPILSANGPAKDIDVRLAPKNNGVVWLGKYTAGTVTHTGTIKVKDINGNIREVLAR